ncbi:MAG: murein biosynthesis integral membrane protein MurJ [Fusobacterium sp.]|nr:murein biosynthesis integral membrane protein MurJ [Fusobacterium sp.]
MFKKSIGTMGITMISRVLGLLRGTLIAYFFGSSGLTDAYYTAFKISNFFRQLLGEGALGNTFIPLYHQKKKEEGDESSKKYIFTVLNMVFIFSFFISILMILFSNYIVNFIVVGFNEEMKILSSNLLKIMSFYFLFISMAGMLSSILNTFGSFMIPASTAIFFNLSIIASAIFLTKYFSISALAYGVLFGGVLQFIVVLLPFLKIMKTYFLTLNFKDKYIKLLGVRLVPMLVGVFARQINSITDQFFASFLVAGSITALENATRIYLLPVGVFGVTLSNIVFPNLSKAAANKDKKTINKNLITALNFLNFLVIPSLIVLTFYSADVIRIIFSYGKFSEKAVQITAQALLFYSLGLLFYVGVQLISKAYYAVGDNRRPARYSICAIIINIILNAILVKTMAHKGLALATSISSGVNFSFLLYAYNKRYVKLNFKSLIKMGIKIFISSFIALLISNQVPDLYFNERLNILIRLFVFAFVYLIQWGYFIYVKREKVFY